MARRLENMLQVLARLEALANTLALEAKGSNVLYQAFEKVTATLDVPVLLETEVVGGTPLKYSKKCAHVVQRLNLRHPIPRQVLRVNVQLLSRSRGLTRHTAHYNSGANDNMSNSLPPD